MKCSKVEVRTDINELITNNYKIIHVNNKCKNCDSKNFIITKNINNLRNKIDENNTKERHILKLIRK